MQFDVNHVTVIRDGMKPISLSNLLVLKWRKHTLLMLLLFAWLEYDYDSGKQSNHVKYEIMIERMGPCSSCTHHIWPALKRERHTIFSFNILLFGISCCSHSNLIIIIFGIQDFLWHESWINLDLLPIAFHFRWLCAPATYI